MNIDPHTGEPIHRGGIWNSDCLNRETAIQTVLFDWLAKHGWVQHPTNYKSWKRGEHTVIVCLVDDLRSCSQDKHTDLPYLFDRNTVVITDGYIGCPTQYRVWQLPPSFFGIYAVNDPLRPWEPDLQYTFSINRIDVRRLRLMLEIAKRIHLRKGYVNFNCQYEVDHFSGNQRVSEYFEQHWNYLSEENQANWRASYNLLKPQIPVKNYTIPHEEIYSRSYVNIECETYSGDNSAAFSEKIFRLLTTPVPWTCYAGRYGIAYLESLGFDCVGDLVDHKSYDQLKEVENKECIFVWKSLQVANAIRTTDFDAVSKRLQQAATYNRELLHLYQRRWSQEFAQWQQVYLAQLA